MAGIPSEDDDSTTSLITAEEARKLTMAARVKWMAEGKLRKAAGAGPAKFRKGGRINKTPRRNIEC